LLSLDGGDTEFRRRVEPINELNPETICERHWVESILQTVLKQLEQECASSGKGRVFESVRDLVTGECEVSCAEAATALNMTPAHVRVIVHRLRQRLRQLLGDAVADENKSESRLKQELLDTYQACRD
jgi:hypothetical protein